MTRLEVHLNEAIVHRVALAPGETTIGRRPTSDLCLNHPAISTNHAVIFTVGSDSFIQDCNSTNGTFFKNRRIIKHHLAHGDEIRIGPYTLVFVSEAQGPDPHGLDEIAASTPEPVAALFVLSGPASGRRIDLTKPMTHLGKPGGQSAVISRIPQGYLLTQQGTNEDLRLNGKRVPVGGEFLQSGDVIDVGESRLQFHRPVE